MDFSQLHLNQQPPADVDIDEAEAVAPTVKVVPADMPVETVDPVEVPAQASNPKPVAKAPPAPGSNGARVKPTVPTGGGKPFVFGAATVMPAAAANDEAPEETPGDAEPVAVAPRPADAPGLTATAGGMSASLIDHIQAGGEQATGGILVQDEGESLRLTTPWSEETISALKAIPDGGASYDKDGKTWLLAKSALTPDVLATLPAAVAAGLSPYLAPDAATVPERQGGGTTPRIDEAMSDLSPHVAAAIERQRVNYLKLLEASDLTPEERQRLWDEYNTEMVNNYLVGLSMINARRGEHERGLAAAAQNAAEGSSSPGLLSALFSGLSPRGGRSSGFVREEEAEMRRVAEFNKLLPQRMIDVKIDRVVANTRHVVAAGAGIEEAVMRLNDAVFSTDGFSAFDQELQAFAERNGKSADSLRADIRSGNCPEALAPALRSVKEQAKDDPRVVQAFGYLAEKERHFEETLQRKIAAEASLNGSLDPFDSRRIDLEQSRDTIDAVVQSVGNSAEKPVVEPDDKGLQARMAEMADRIRERIEAMIQRVVSAVYAPANDSGPAPAPRMGMSV